jgi:hypothetical protein
MQTDISKPKEEKEIFFKKLQDIIDIVDIVVSSQIMKKYSSWAILIG